MMGAKGGPAIHARSVTRNAFRRTQAFPLGVFALFTAACGISPQTAVSPDAAAPPPHLAYEHPLQPGEAVAGRPVSATLLGEGEAVYRQYCAGCHGEAGDGNGPAARFLDPKPRDFRTATFKFAGVAAGQLPRDEDLLRTITRGLPGSSMPAWQALPEGQRRAVIAWLKTFSPEWQTRSAGPPIAVSEDPWSATDPATAREAIARGRVVYHALVTCWQCHPAYATQEEVSAMALAEQAGVVTLREDAGRPVPKPDVWEHLLTPTDFPRRRLKSGSSLQDLYRTISSGVGGTAMPTWKDGLPEKDLWALAYYVKSLADGYWRAPSPVPAPPQDALMKDEVIGG